MTNKQVILGLALAGIAFFASGSPGTGVRGAHAQVSQRVRVRVDFRTLFCQTKTGDELGGNDEPYAKYVESVSGSTAKLRSIAKRSVKEGSYVWDGDSRQILWEGNLDPGQAAVFIVYVMEDDGSPPKWSDWLSNAGSCGGALVDAATNGPTGATVLGCVGVGGNLIRAVNGDDEIGQFTLTVKNENGVVKKALHTSGARSQIGAYGDTAASSESGKTIRMRLGQGKEHPQQYQASLQVRQIKDIIADVDGEALTWTVTGRDDAK
ncbi:MAG TPA: hypothetical protein VHM70_11330 [Polyangiaceae bacterium]|jgi:hypothetical protein|nr:hypothetical protein [Polyangiaceae bacterium]